LAHSASYEPQNSPFDVLQNHFFFSNFARLLGISSMDSLRT